MSGIINGLNPNSAFLPELLSFTDHSNLKSLIGAQSSGEEKVQLSEFEQKGLVKKIKKWNDILDQKLEENRYTPQGLQRLKDLAHGILYDQSSNAAKSSIIRAKLRCGKISNVKIDKALDRFDELMLRIDTTPILSDKLNEQPSSNFFPFFQNPIGFLHHPMFPSPVFVDEKLKNKVDAKKNELQLRLLSQQFIYLNSTYDKEWKKDLIQALELLDNEEKVKNVVKVLNDEQILFILTLGFEYAEDSWKIPLFIGSVPLEKLEKALRSLNNEQLHSINLKLCKMHGSHYLEEQVDAFLAMIASQLEEQKNMVDEIRAVKITNPELLETFFKGLLENRIFLKRLSRLMETHSDGHINEQIVELLKHIERWEQKLEPLARLQKLNQIFLPLSSEQNPTTWKLQLSDEFESLALKEEVQIVTQTLSFEQTHYLYEFCFTNQNNRWKLPYFIASMPYVHLEKILASTTNKYLTQLNGILSEESKDAKIWFNNNFSCQPFINRCNSWGPEIDKLTERLRRSDYVQKISFSDIKEIETLKQKILFSSRSLKALRELLYSVLLNAESKFVIGELDDVYLTHISRLEPEGPHLPSAKGCVYDIIHRIVFHRELEDEDKRLDDKDEAVEILAFWRIATIDDYFNVNLLPGYTKDQIDDFKKSPDHNNPSILYNHSKKFLDKLGIKTIKDWKTLHIYNSQMLKEYLARPEIANQGLKK